ncbi:MAG: hypothetical protein NVS3B20_22710 [Polyangiales bacterium]
MGTAFLPPLLVAVGGLLGVVLLRKFRGGDTQTQWPVAVWIVLVLGGAVAAAVVRAVETLVSELAVGGRLAGAEGVRQTIFAFGIVAPFTVLTVAAVVWPTLTRGLAADTDPPLAAAASACGLVVGRICTRLFLEHLGQESGVRAAILGIDDIAIAAMWGYGLALSSFDGTPGGSPFGRYALTAMLLRGGVEIAHHSEGRLGIPIALGIGFGVMLFAGVGVFRLARSPDAPPSSLASAGQETIREFARTQLRRGAVRPLWIVVGALANVGGIILGFATAVGVGHSASIDFGEIDRSGPGAEYAALLLALGVIFSFPMSAAVVGMASAGRASVKHAHVLEAGIAAIVALAACLSVLGVVAPVAFAIGLACAPVAFAMAGLGAWIAAGRNI